MIINAISGKNLPIYGKGLNIRDWLYVYDHCEAIQFIIDKGKLGETYNIGGDNEIKNIHVVETICEILDTNIPLDNGDSYKKLMTYVQDRPGHDFRYAIDASKIKSELGWRPKEDFKTGIQKTILWYLE